MTHPDKAFKHIVFDPPHLLRGGVTGWQRKKYGILNEQTWREDLKTGFAECWRLGCLRDPRIQMERREHPNQKDPRSLSDSAPIYGHPTARSGTTSGASL